LNHEGAELAIVVAILWGIAAYRQRQHFSGLFVQRISQEFRTGRRRFLDAGGKRA
jgi:hypothetical protein